MYKHESDERFLLAMAALAEATSQECGELKIRIYAQALNDIPIASIEQAVWSLIRTRTFATFPKVAEIFEHINGKPEDQALLALDKVEKAIREVGGYTSVICDDPVIHRVINSFHNGWIGICEMTLEEWKWARKDFLKMYQAFAQQSDMQTPIKLYGRHDLHNETHGYIASGRAHECLTYVGNEQKARSWVDKQIALNSNTKQLTDNIKEVAHVSCA